MNPLVGRKVDSAATPIYLLVSIDPVITKALKLVKWSNTAVKDYQKTTTYLR